MNEWKKVKLGDLLEEYCERNTNNEYIAVAVGKYGIRKREDIYTKELSKDISKNKIIMKNTLTIGMGSNQIDIGILTDDCKFCVSPAYTTYKIKKCNSKFLEYYMEYLNPKLSDLFMIVSARQGKSVDKNGLLEYTINMPTIEEQIKIVDIIKNVDKIIELMNEKIKKSQLLKKKYINEIFNNFENNEIVLFDKIISEMADIGSNGSNKDVVKHLDMKDENDYAIMLRTSNLSNDDFVNDVKYISKEAYEYFKKSKIYGNEIIMNKIGSPGKYWMAPKLSKPMSLGLNQFFIRINENVNTKYVFYFLSCKYAQKQIRKNISGGVTKSITKNAVKASIKNARKIDMNLVDAQQSRRVLDRMVGYQISPLLWAKIKRGLSAGRVQSVALRIICDREDEINSFIPQEYWTMEAVLDVKGEKKPLTAKFYGDADGKIDIKDEAQIQEITQAVEKEKFYVESIKKGEKTKKCPLPFTTSTLQQEAAKTLNFSTQKTMRLAQQLYEGVDIAGRGTIGVISYLRTDSTRVADEAVAMAAEYIEASYGKDYVGNTGAGKKDDKKIQDAHEAIRPTDIALSPVVIKESLSRDQFRLYQLIWKRFTASQMSPAVYETISVKIAAGKYRFTVAASKVKFEGFLSVYKDNEEKEASNALVKGIDEQSELTLNELNPQQHFTQPPAHYTEASLVKTLEELGIGRPSTYAPTITTIIARHYVAKENKNLYVTELGEAVNNIMKKAFPSIVDVNFTANMESLLDGVEEGSVKWKEVIRNFYPDLNEAVKAAEKELESVKIEDEVTDVVCEKCGRNMVVKYGPHGKFLGCPGFPECRNTKPYLEKIGVACPKCGKEVVMRKTKKGRRYFGCEDNPECDFMTWQKPSNKKCPKCGGYMLEKGNKLVCGDENCGYVENRENDENK